MRLRSRRSLLAGTASALALGAAGCMGEAEPSDEPDEENGGDEDGGDDQTDEDASSLPAGVETLLAYVYDTDGGTRVTIGQPDDESETSPTFGSPSLAGEIEFDWHGSVSGSQRESDMHGLVGVGSFDVNAGAADLTADGSRGAFDTYVGQNGGDAEVTVATDGDVLLRGTRDWVDTTLSRHGSDAETFLEANPGTRSILAELPFRGSVFLIDDPAAFDTAFENGDLEASQLPDRFAVEMRRTDDAVSQTLVARYPGGADVEDVDAVERLANSGGLAMADPTVELRDDDRLVVAEASRPYTPPEERPDVPSFPRYDGYDDASGRVRFRLEDGDDLPVEHFELEIDDEVYGGDWARGQDEIGEGDVIAVDADAIEPGDHLSLSYESPDGSFSSGGGTTALHRLPFDVDFDPDARTASITYGDGPPLPASRVSAVVGDDERTIRPWSGELVAGDAATVSDLPMRARLTIEYERSDGETVRIGGGHLDVPGHFRFEYDGQAAELTIECPDVEAELDDVPERARREVPDQEPLDASRYEITVDGRPADRQWSDVGTEIRPGETLALDEIPVDTAVSVVWRSESGQRYEVTSTLTVPDVEFSFDYDPEHEALTVRHAGGQPVVASRLSVRFFHPEDERTVQLDREGTLAAGDEVVIEDVPEDTAGGIQYRDRHLQRVHPREILAGE